MTGKATSATRDQHGPAGSEVVPSLGVITTGLGAHPGVITTGLGADPGYNSWVTGWSSESGGHLGGLVSEPRDGGGTKWHCACQAQSTWMGWNAIVKTLIYFPPCLGNQNSSHGWSVGWLTELEKFRFPKVDKKGTTGSQALQFTS